MRRWGWILAAALGATAAVVLQKRRTGATNTAEAIIARCEAAAGALQRQLEHATI